MKQIRGYIGFLLEDKMPLMLSVIAWLANSLAYLSELSVYALRAIWVTIVRATLALLEVLDDWLPTLDILENALMRLLVMGGLGFFVGVALMIILSLIMGNWGIPCCFGLVIGFCAFVGLVADPERDWSIGEFPRHGGPPGPQTPLNL
jgi:hypothetical protein